VRHGIKFAVKQLHALKISPHIKLVATLFTLWNVREIAVIKTCVKQTEVQDSNCHARFGRCRKYSAIVMWASHNSLMKIYSQYPRRAISMTDYTPTHMPQQRKRTSHWNSFARDHQHSVSGGVCQPHEFDYYCLSQMKLNIITANNSSCLPNSRPLTSSFFFCWTMHTQRNKINFLPVTYTNVHRF